LSVSQPYPGQVNAVAPLLTPGTTVLVAVTKGCGTPNELPSLPQPAIVKAAAPEFLYFAHNANGQNPAAAINAATGAYVGPVELGSGFAPAHPGDLVTIFASGFGPTDPPAAPGVAASGIARVTSAVTVKLGSVTLDPSDILYVGAAPDSVISQLNIRIPSGIPAGNQPIQIVIAGIASPAGAFLPIATP